MARMLNLPLRVDAATLARVDAVAAEMARIAGLGELGRSEVARALLLTGLAEHEKRLGIASATAPTQSPKAEKGGKRPPRKA